MTQAEQIEMKEFSATKRNKKDIPLLDEDDLAVLKYNPPKYERKQKLTEY
jgi:hypothetical protein